jgi:hypothetical protein
VAREMARTGPDSPTLRSVLREILDVALRWERDRGKRGHPETRAAEEDFLRTLVECAARLTQRREVARRDPHKISEHDLRAVGVRASVVEILVGWETSEPDEVEAHAREALRRAGFRVSAAHLAEQIAKLRVEHGRADNGWIPAAGGPSDAADELLSRIGIGSATHLRAARKALPTATSWADVALEARGSSVSTADRIRYGLLLAGLSERQAERALRGIVAGKPAPATPPRVKPRSKPPTPR